MDKEHDEQTKDQYQSADEKILIFRPLHFFFSFSEANERFIYAVHKIVLTCNCSCYRILFRQFNNLIWRKHSSRCGGTGDTQFRGTAPDLAVGNLIAHAFAVGCIDEEHAEQCKDQNQSADKKILVFRLLHFLFSFLEAVERFINPIHVTAKLCEPIAENAPAFLFKRLFCREQTGREGGTGNGQFRYGMSGLALRYSSILAFAIDGGDKKHGEQGNNYKQPAHNKLSGFFLIHGILFKYQFYVCHTG
jgi:hypothetical protein